MSGYDNAYHDPEQTHRTIIDWCAKAVDYVSYLKKTTELAENQKHSLNDWQDAFQQLAMKSKNAEIGTSTYAESVNRLLQESHSLQDRFTRFMQAQPLTKQGVRDARQTIEEYPDEAVAVSNATNTRLGNASMGPVPIGGHTLPPLPYDYNALEPYIDEQTMRLHHDKHHKSYVDGLNKAEKMMERARKTGDFDLITHWEREAAFHGAGHYLHTIFWNNMTPRGGGEPTGSLLAQIHQDFGSFSAFKKHFSAAAEKAEAVGWAILVWAPRAHRLEILQAEKHQNLSQWDVIPLLVLDVWEHAYYLKYQNNRKSYIEAWWNVVNWDHVKERYEKARMLTWKPY